MFTVYLCYGGSKSLLSCGVSMKAVSHWMLHACTVMCRPLTRRWRSQRVIWNVIVDTRHAASLSYCHLCVCLCACALRVLPVLFRVYPPTVQIGPLNVDIRGVNIWQYLNVGKVLPASTVLLNCQLWNRLFFSLVEVTEMTYVLLVSCYDGS